MGGVDRERWRALDPLLDEALELPAAERSRWLEQLRAQSPTLADEVGALLLDEGDADRMGFLTSPLSASFSGSIDAPLAGPFEGLRLGAYVLERPLGQGGMGSVWLARRADGRFEGHVAIKLLHLALFGDAGQERFRREGSVLARLAHPNIARLLDAGVTEGGQPYLVLERVEGQWIDAFADERRLGVAERVALVLQVLAAVGHAHAQLVVHRDLKPSNILVTSDGTAKLLDFGIAALLDSDGSGERTALTSDGTRALTPEYAAPEQLRGDPVTTATDVYAVGVLLYGLLTGRRPYDLAGRSAAEVERIVTEVDPPRPSATFGATSIAAVAENAAERARARGTTPDRLRRELAGDLDAIVLKALHKAPERRYHSATALADDLERFLAGRPVLARPDGTAYRVRKFVGRHRGGVAVVTAVGVLLAGAAVRERGLRAVAEAETREAQAVTEYLVSVFDDSDPFANPIRRGDDAASGPGEPLTARAMLDRGAARVDSALAGQPDVQAELRSVLGRVYASLGLDDRAAPLLERALAHQRAVHGPRHRAVADAMDRLGAVLVRQEDFGRAEPLLREALAQRRALHGDVSAPTAESLDHLATLFLQRGAFDAAAPLFREAIAVRRAVHSPDHSELAGTLNNLGLLLLYRGAYDDAEPLFRQALAIRGRRLGDAHPLTAITLHNLAQVQEARGRYGEADTLYRRALDVKRRTLGDAHPAVTVNLNNLGTMLAEEMGRPDDGEVLVREALTLNRRIYGERHATVATNLGNLATVMRMKGDVAEAERLHREALAMNRALFGPDDIRVAIARDDLAQTLHLAGDLPGAIALYRQALADYDRQRRGPRGNSIATSISLARALTERGGRNVVEAEQLLRTTAARLDTTSRMRRPQLIALEVALGETLVELGRAAEALPGLERALAMSRQRFGDDHWRTAEARLVLGRALVATGRPARAEPLLRAADATLARHRRAQPRLAARATAALRALERAGA